MKMQHGLQKVDNRIWYEWRPTVHSEVYPQNKNG